MDINLPLILFVAVVLSGIGYFYDWFCLRKPRRAKIDAINQSFADKEQAELESNAEYQELIAQAQQEPVYIEYSKSFFPVLLLVFVLRSFIIEPFQIPSESMLPTLEVGDFIVVNKFTYGIRLPIIHTKVVNVNDPKRGDVMVFFPPNESRYFIKRVIGLPGDTISYINNRLSINGELVEQEYTGTDVLTRLDPCTRYGASYQLFEEHLPGRKISTRKCSLEFERMQQAQWTVPNGHYFMMGDNRDNSSDSRAWGFVPEKNIVGKAFAIWMHWDSFFSLPSFHRLGKI